MMSAQTIYKIIPQRYPFMMIDRIISHEFQKKAVCQKNITLGEEVLAGHFPGNPIYPGVLLVEMGLQTTQVMLTNLETLSTAPQPEAESKLVPVPAPESVPEPVQGFLLMIEKFRFSKPARPGDVLEITSELYQQALGLVKAKIKLVNQSGEVVAEGIVAVGAAR